MKRVKFDLDNDPFAPELETWRVWIDGREKDARTVIGRSAAYRLIEKTKASNPDIPRSKMPTFRIKRIASVPF